MMMRSRACSRLHGGGFKQPVSLVSGARALCPSVPTIMRPHACFRWDGKSCSLVDTVQRIRARVLHNILFVQKPGCLTTQHPGCQQQAQVWEPRAFDSQAPLAAGTEPHGTARYQLPCSRTFLSHHAAAHNCLPHRSPAHVDSGRACARGMQRRHVDQVGKVGATEARRGLCDGLQGVAHEGRAWWAPLHAPAAGAAASAQPLPPGKSTAMLQPLLSRPVLPPTFTSHAHARRQPLACTCARTHTYQQVHVLVQGDVVGVGLQDLAPPQHVRVGDDLRSEGGCCKKGREQ